MLQQAERVLGLKPMQCPVEMQSLQPALAKESAFCLSKTPPCMAAERVPAVPVQLAGDPVPEAVPRPQAGEQLPRITVVCAAALW